MRDHDSATARESITGALFGAVGVLGFSLSLPATRVAVGGLSPWFVACGRAVGAALLGLAYLGLTRTPRPTGGQWWRLGLVAGGVVLGFPLFTSLALTTQTAAHGAVVTAVLPAVTAVFAVLRARERPTAAFWFASGAGLIAVLVFVTVSGGVGGRVRAADLYLVAAVLLCALGYAEGGLLARELGGARTICWALVLALPVTASLTVATALLHPPHTGPVGWFGFGYLTVVSMFLAFFAWYTGLARGGVARIGQIQLAQPVLTLVWSAILLAERVTTAAITAATVVLACVIATQRTRRPTGTTRPAEVPAE